MKDFFFGFSYPFKSISFFRKHPKIILYSIIPFIINVIIYVTVFYFAYGWIIGFSGDITGTNKSVTSWWQEFLNILILVISFILLLIVCYLVFIIFSSIITAPFNEKISCIVEEIVTKEKIENKIGFWKDILISIEAELLKLFFYFSILIPILLLNFIPVVGTIISTTLGVIFSFFYNALDFLDYPMTRMQYSLKKKISIVASKKMLSLGFGCSVFLILFIPFINALLKPICVIEGTALFFEKDYIEKKLIKQN